MQVQKAENQSSPPTQANPPAATVRKWAASTQSRLELFLDDYLIRSPISSVRQSSQKLIQSLFKKGNQQQKIRIMGLLQSRCDKLKWMGRASWDFFALLGGIFDQISQLQTNTTTNENQYNLGQFDEYKAKIVRKIFGSIQIIHKNIVNNPNYQFYSFASNLIDFGNEQFKPYLLQPNGCLNCFNRTQPKSETFRFQNCIQTTKIFTHKLQYLFKRIYDVKQLTIALKANNRMKSVSIWYMDAQGQYKPLPNPTSPSSNKFKLNDPISGPSSLTMQGILFQFEVSYIGIKKRVQCIFCDNTKNNGDELLSCNSVCSVCAARSESIDFGGSWRAIGADQSLLMEELCKDYEKIQDNVQAIKGLYRKMEARKKIVFNFKLQQMVEIYQRIVNNLVLLHQKNASKLKAKQDQNCFSCNYYQMVNIVKFLKQITKKHQAFSLGSSATRQGLISQKQITKFKQNLRKCLSQNKMELLKVSLLQVLSLFIVNVNRKDQNIKNKYKQEFFNVDDKFMADLIANVLIALKQKRSLNPQCSIEDQLTQIREFLQANASKFKLEQKVRLFTCFFLEYQNLLTLLPNSNNPISHTSQLPRLTTQQSQQLKSLITFSPSQIFSLPLDSYLKAFLKIAPLQMVPCASLDIGDWEFLHYVDNKIPQIEGNKVQEGVIYSPNPMIKLDLFASLPVLIGRLGVKESMQVMNSLFPYKNIWNMNIYKAGEKFSAKLSQLPPQQQISTCLTGYTNSHEYLYIQKLHKLLVPQRLQFIIRLEAPLSEIEQNNIEYPYLPVRQVKSEDLQGDNIRALHNWIYNQLVKMNQAMPLDIIVQKSIIDNMDMPIQLVYLNVVQKKEKRKIGDKEYEFFRVVYRIQGMFGEPKQRGIGNYRDQRLETCIEYASLFLNRFNQDSKKIGLDVLIQLLQQIQPGAQSDSKKVILFQILSTMSTNEAICKKIVEQQYGDSIINATVRLMAFDSQRNAKITNFLLQLSSKVIDEANQQMINLRKGSIGQYRKMSGNIGNTAMDIEKEGGISDSQRKVKFVLQKIGQCQQNFEKSGNTLYRDISKKLIKLLPFCSKDEEDSSKILFNFFEFASWSTKSSSKMQNLFIFMDSLSQSYMTFKGIASQKGVTAQIIKTITNSIRKQGTQQVEQKKLSTNKSQTQSALLLLCALIQGDQNLQGTLFDSQIFHNIYAISQIAPKKASEIHAGRVPEYCYKIIKYLSQGKIVERRIHQFLQQKKQVEKQKMQPKKNKKLQQMRNKQKKLIQNKMIDENQQSGKDQIVCSSCLEGYSKKREILGLYIYQTKNESLFQNNWWKENRKINSFSSTTFFTPIHFQCHMRAYEADQKISRSEWDGALIRNMDVLCNSWIPFKGPKTTYDQFSRVERKYFQKNKNGNYWNVVNDLNTLLDKLSIQFDFATESKGSSSSHNCRLIPILIQFGCHMIERSGGCPSIQQGVAYFSQNPPKKFSQMSHLLCYSIFSQPYSWFSTFKPIIVKMLATSSQQAQNFQLIKSHLVFYKLVENIYQIIHKQLPAASNEKIYKQIDQLLSQKMEETIKNFEQLNQRYKTKYTKFGSFNDFLEDKLEIQPNEPEKKPKDEAAKNSDKMEQGQEIKK